MHSGFLCKIWSDPDLNTVFEICGTCPCCKKYYIMLVSPNLATTAFRIHCAMYCHNAPPPSYIMISSSSCQGSGYGFPPSLTVPWQFLVEFASTIVIVFTVYRPLRCCDIEFPFPLLAGKTFATIIKLSKWGRQRSGDMRTRRRLHTRRENSTRAAKQSPWRNLFDFCRRIRGGGKRERGRVTRHADTCFGKADVWFEIRSTVSSVLRVEFDGNTFDILLNK